MFQRPRQEVPEAVRKKRLKPYAMLTTGSGGRITKKSP